MFSPLSVEEAFKTHSRLTNNHRLSIGYYFDREVEHFTKEHLV